MLDPQGDPLRALGEVSAEILHELRNELQGISVAAYAARLTAPSPEVRRIEVHATSAQYIVEDLLLLLRPDELPKTTCTLHQLCAAAFEPFALRASMHVAAPESVELRVHPRLWMRMLRALLSNAVECKPTPATCTVAWLEESSGAQYVHITDDGPGINAALQPELFAPLASARLGGTGFGLALARRIARRHGGELVLLRSVPGETVFAYHEPTK
jgi:two-component system, OmpR family, sensor kinase